MANQIDYSPLGAPTPETGVSRGLTFLGNTLDAIMERRSREAMHKAQLDQQAALAAEDDKRLRDQLSWQMKHQGAEEDIAREKNAADEADKASGRALTAMPHFQAALDSGDTEAAQQWAGPGGIQFKPQAPTPAMDMLGALTAQPAPADPLGSPPPPPGAGGEEAAMGGRPSGTQPMAPPAMDPLQAQLPPLDIPPKPTKYDVTVGGQTSVYDPAAVQARRQARGAQVAADLGGVQSPSRFHDQALAEVQAQARTGRFKSDDEILKAYEERRKDLEHEANAADRARIVAATRGNSADRVHPPGELDFLDEGGKVIGKARSPEEGQKFRVARDALVGITSAGKELKSHLLAHGRTDVLGVPIENGDVRGQREALISNVTDYLTTLKNTGVLNGGEYDRYVGLLGTSLMRGGSGAAKVIDEVLNGARTHYYSHSGSARANAPAPAARAASPSTVDVDALTDELTR